MDNLYNNYIYAIAQGRTLAYINSLKQGAQDGHAALQSIADNVGAKLELGYQGAAFIFNHDAAVPQGWKKPEQFGRIQIPPPPPRYVPDEDTPEGLAIRESINEACSKRGLRKIFDAACHRAAPCSYYNTHEFAFEDLGGLTIVQCPVVHYDHNNNINHYFLPPDCQQISFPVYAALKSESFKDRPREIKSFTKDFE